VKIFHIIQYVIGEAGGFFSGRRILGGGNAAAARLFRKNGRKWLRNGVEYGLCVGSATPPPVAAPNDETPMPDFELSPARRRLILAHALFVGLTPLIPAPFADDLAMSYFQRRCVRLLAAEYGVTLSEADIVALADGPGGGFFSGLAKKVLAFPVKLLSRTVRKLLAVLEYKRMGDVMSVAYHQGYLLDYVFHTAWRDPRAPRDAAAVRRAMDRACEIVGVKPVGFVFQTVLSSSKAALANVVAALTDVLRTRLGGPPAPDADERRLAEGVVERLARGVREVPSAHFERLRAVFDSELFGENLPKRAGGAD
jgi:hypothetical protein